MNKLGLLFVGILFFTIPVFAQSTLPAQPTSPEEPGSSYYPTQIIEKTFVNEGRKIEFFAPATAPSGKRLPVIVFGHGHDVPLIGYKTTLEHLAHKGIAVIYPEYTVGAGKDFEIMAYSYMKDVAFILSQFTNQLDPSMVIFSGHSNGARVALMAAGLPSDKMIIKPRALILFETAGYMEDYIKRIDPRTVITVVVGDRDTNTPPDFSRKIYGFLGVQRKQFILLSSYVQTKPEVIADHGAVRTFGLYGPTVTPLHYYGFWKFLVAGAWDLMNGGKLTNPYLYGNLAASTGIPGFFHHVERASGVTLTEF